MSNPRAYDYYTGPGSKPPGINRHAFSNGGINPHSFNPHAFSGGGVNPHAFSGGGVNPHAFYGGVNSNSFNTSGGARGR
jgi:hypothetical protein